jgi:hypothetical protein
MESAAAPNSGARARSCGVVEAASSAEDAGWSGLVSEAARRPLLTARHCDGYDKDTVQYSAADQLDINYL